MICQCSCNSVFCFFDNFSSWSSWNFNVWAIHWSFECKVWRICLWALEDKIIIWSKIIDAFMFNSLKLIDAFIFSSFKLFINAFIVAEMNVSLSVVSSLLYSISWKWYFRVELQCWEIEYRCNIESFEINRVSMNTCN